MVPWRFFQANRALVTALVTLSCLGLFAMTLDQSNRESLQNAYQNAKNSYTTGEDVWVDAKTRTNGRQGKALSFYPGRKPRTVQALIENAEGYYARIVKQRHELLKENHFGTNEFEPWSLKTFMYWWGYFPASFICPHEIQRVGPLADGGKWICGMSLYEDQPRSKCILYSFGINHETRFEGDILDRTDCEIFAYDASVDGMGPECQNRPNVYFKPYFIGNKDMVDDKGIQWRTLRSLMKENGHEWIDILKVDIEGSEFPTFDAIMDDFGEVLPFSQLQMELHVRQDFVSFPVFLKWWERLESKGVYPWWTEINLSPVYMKQGAWASEYCFINTRDTPDNKNLLVQNYF